MEAESSLISQGTRKRNAQRPGPIQPLRPVQPVGFTSKWIGSFAAYPAIANALEDRSKDSRRLGAKIFVEYRAGVAPVPSRTIPHWRTRLSEIERGPARSSEVHERVKLVGILNEFAENHVKSAT